MPELPEVERGRKLAEAVTAGRRIERVWCDDDPLVFAGVEPARWRRTLQGKRVVAARRWGKQLWLELDASPHPLFHFGMSGGFKTPSSTPLQLKSGPREDTSVWPPRFLKIRLHLDDGGELAMTDGRRLGRILLREDPEREPPVAKLGFDPLLAMPTPKRFCRIAARPRRASSSRCSSTRRSRPEWATGSPTRCSSSPGSIPDGGRLR